MSCVIERFIPFVKHKTNKKAVEPIVQKNDDDFTINIMNPNLNFVTNDKFATCNVLYNQFLPKLGFKITSVRDDNAVIWDGSRKLKHAVVALKDDKPYMLWVNLSWRDNKFFVKSDDTWTEITIDDYKSKLKFLSRSVDIKNRITIDVDNPKNDRWTAFENEQWDMKRVIFYPNVGYLATAVFGSEKPIWEAKNDDEVCITAVLYYCKHEAVFAYLLIRDCRAANDAYYHYANDKWVETDEDECINRFYRFAPWFFVYLTVMKNHWNIYLT